MMPKYDVIVCTNIYNRTHTLPDYMEAFLKNTKKETKYHIYFIANYDELCPKGKIVDDIHYDLDRFAWDKFGIDRFDGKHLYDVLPMPNIGLSGYNIGLEIGKTLNYTPVLCMNDDTLVCKNWEKLLELPTKAIRQGMEFQIRPESVGVIGPTYINCGSMKHQQFIKNENHYSWVDFVVGHAQLVTTNALKKGFRYTPEQCLGFGSYDIAQSMLMLSLELNLLVAHGLDFDFPDSQESHFHNGDIEKFSCKGLAPNWKQMQQNLEEFQKEHVKKYGCNKWYFE